MDRSDNPFNLFPRDKFNVHMKHFHPGNSTLKERQKAAYLSMLRVDKLDTGQFFIVTAKCCEGDTPSRARAREVLRLKAQTAASALEWI